MLLACLLCVGKANAQDTLTKHLNAFFRTFEPTTYEGFRKMIALKPLVLTKKYQNEGLKYKFKQKLGFAFGVMGYQDSLLRYTADLTYGMLDSTLQTKDFKAVEALDYLVEKAKKHQIVFINEAHHLAHHRAFTAKLLEALRKEGFTYFGAEMWLNNPNNQPYHAQGYPVKMSMTPAYDEPYSRMMFRKAFQLGYQIVPYEIEDFEYKNLDTSFVRLGLKIDDDNDRREWTQAVNLYKRVLAKDKNAKIIIHCGYDHLAKVPFDGWIPMAYCLQKITGIEPFVITQANELTFGDKYYQEVMETYKSKEPFILLDKKDKKPWLATYQSTKSVDALVLTPPQKRYKFDNPAINYTNSKKPSHKIALSQFKQSAPYLLEVYFAGEDEKAMPVYQLEIASPAEAQNTLKLYLPKNKSLNIKLISTEGKVLEEKKL